MSLISVWRMGLRPELPLELLYNVVDICARNNSLKELRTLRLVSRSLNRQARKHLWNHIALPPRKAVRLDRDGKDFSFLVDALSSLPDIPLYTKSLYMASYPPEVLSPFLQRLTFSALHQVTIHGYDPRVSKAPASVTLSKLLRTNPTVHTLKLCTFRMNAIAFLELLSQAELHELRHCTLDNINTTVDDSWDDYLSNPSSGSVDNFLVKRSQEKSAARSPLTSLYLNRVTNLPNTAFNKALFGHPHSLFDISALETLTLCIASYPPVPLWHFNEVIELCCPSVKSLKIRNWQDVAHSDASLLTKFNNVTHVALDFYGGTGLGGLKTSMELALEHLAQLKSLKKLKFTIESYRKLGSLVLGLEEGLDALCHEVTGIEEIVISVKSLSSENYDREEVFVWDRERCLLSTEVL